MRTLVVVAALAAWQAGDTPVRAGLYNTAEREPAAGPLLTFKEFRDSLDSLRNIGRPEPESVERKRYLLMAKVDSRGRGVELTPEQRMNLGAYLIRLGKYEEASEVLRALEGSKNAMALANLATAEQYSDRPDRAEGHLERALKYWPPKWEGKSEVEVQRYHEAEKLHLRLIRLRSRAAMLRRPGASPPTLELDDLFQVRWVGESGQYEAGSLAAEEKKKLPANALMTVEQLLLWMPNDLGLYWLLAEVLNASGEVKEAAAVMHELEFNYRVNSPMLKDHRRTLQEALASRLPEPPVTGDEKKDSSAANGTGTTKAPMTDALTAAGIGAVAGMLVMGLIVFQASEILRRRRQAAARRG